MAGRGGAGRERPGPAGRIKHEMGGDYKNLPLWKKGMSLAHAVYAAVEAAGTKSTDSGIRLRKAAVSVPSLVGEAFLDASERDVHEALALAEAKLAEVRTILTSEQAAGTIAPDDLAGLLADLDGLRSEIAGFIEEKGRETSH